MTARIESGEARTCSRDSTTGGACTRFCVNTAAAEAGKSETIMRDVQRAGVAALFQAARCRSKTKPARQGAGRRKFSHLFDHHEKFRFSSGAGFQPAGVSWSMIVIAATKTHRLEACATQAVDRIISSR